MTDETDSPEFVEDTMNRLMSWEWVHGVYCAGKSLRPCRLAERVGIPTVEAQELVKESLGSAKKELVHRGVL